MQMRLPRPIIASVFIAGLAGAALAAPADLPREKTVGSAKLEIVHEFRRQMPVGVAVTSTGRRFVSYPRWEDPLTFTLAELKNGREVPYPAAGAIQNGAKSGPQKTWCRCRDCWWTRRTGSGSSIPARST
jgi:hypothetical protein